MMRPVRRVSAARWRALSTLLMGLERGVEAAARLDAHDAFLVRQDAGELAGTLLPQEVRSRAVHLRAAEWFDTRLIGLERRLDRELDRLTAERGALDLVTAKAHAATVDDVAHRTAIIDRMAVLTFLAEQPWP